VIPRDYILEWREQAPWPQDFQVEQDLIISRALVEIFSHPLLHDALAFRGGTALYKLHLKPAARYSEDIDLVQTRAEAAGPMMNALRDVLDPWLGKPQWKQTDGRITFVYKINSEDAPPVPLRLKIETNTREHFSVFGLKEIPFAVDSRWFEGSCSVHTYALDELLGTKLRALYQRKQGRDLFDLAIALQHAAVDPPRVVAAFSEYMRREDKRVTRAQFEQNFFLKLRDHEFNADIGPLLALRDNPWDTAGEAAVISSRLIELLPGESWKGEAATP
jgi:predicted nucleotidyltransferase component of viral defense system